MVDHDDSVQWVEVGRVARAHGIRGELRIKLFNASSEVLFDVPEVLIRTGGKPDETMAVTGARAAAQGIILLSLQGVFDRTSAEQLQGATVLVSRELLPDTEEGEFYVHDILGALVFDEAGQEIGKVVDYVSYPTADVLVVQGHHRYEIPMVEGFVTNVDTMEKTVRVRGVEDFKVT